MVYVVLHCQDDGGWKLTNVVGVFKTREAARNYTKSQAATMYDYDDEWYEVEEWPVKES